MNIINKPIDSIVPYANNPRRNGSAVDKVAASIKEFGFKVPIIIDKESVVVAGHTRLLAAKKLGLESAPCVVADDLTPAQIKAFRIADNKTAEFSEWDDELLRIELEQLSELNFDLDLTGFSVNEIDDLSKSEASANVTEDDFDEPVPENPYSKRGDIWLMGQHRLMCGDSTLAEDVSTLMNGKKARIVFTDPPWNVDYGGDTKHPSWKSRTILNDKMSTEDFGAFLLKAFTCMRDVSEPGCMTYVVMSAQEWGSMMDVSKEVGLHWSSTIIWAKDSLVLSRKDYHTQYEPIWYGWLDSGSRLCPLEDRKQTDVWNINRPKVSKEHPTMKPIELVAKALINSSHTGDQVLDLFGGSGSTVLAAEQTGRVCSLMELAPNYCDVIVKRFYQSFPDKDISLVRNGETILLKDTELT